MSTPILNPNSSLTSNITSSSPIHIELGKILRQHDPNAIRLYDFVNHIKVFHYNINEFRWENQSYIEGNLFVYEKQSQQIINNQTYRCFAFAVINREQHMIQEIELDMSEQVEKLCLFYEILINDQRQVFCLNFLNENQCQRVHMFINRAIQLMRKIKDEEQQQQIPVNISRSISSRQINVNGNSEDPTSSLKRLLNISNPNLLNNESMLFQPQQQSVNLLPPSAFQTLGAQSDKSNLSYEHFRNVLLDLVKTNDHFLDIIHQAYLTQQLQ